MAITQISDIFEPDPSSRYFLEMNTSRNMLVQSGIATSSPELSDLVINQGGKTVDMPFWDDLPHDAAATSRSKVVTDDTTAITPDNLSTDYDVAAKLFRSQSWETAAIVKYVAGDDPIGRMMERYAAWWSREEQRLMLKTLTGLFASGGALATTHNHDISIEDGNNATDANKISGQAINAARFKLGDAFDMLTAIVMHSTVFQHADDLGLINYENGPTFIDVTTGNERRMPTWGNITILVDDGMTTTAGSTSGYKYSTYLFGAGAFARVKIPVSQGPGASLNEVVLDVEETEGTGAGTAQLITRWYGILHPRGVRFGGSLSGVTGPSDTLLETAGSWTKAFLDKHIRIARLVTNG